MLFKYGITTYVVIFFGKFDCNNIIDIGFSNFI